MLCAALYLTHRRRRVEGRRYQRESSDIIVLLNQLSGCKLSAKTGLGMDWKKSASALGQLTTVHKFKAPLNMAGDYQHAEDAAYGQQKYLLHSAEANQTAISF
jgi:hypothetical protein